MGALLALGWFGGTLGGEATELDDAAGASNGFELVDGTELFSGGGPAGGSNGFDMVLYSQGVAKIKAKEDRRRRPASPATSVVLALPSPHTFIKQGNSKVLRRRLPS